MLYVLYLYISTFLRMCTVPNMTAYCSSLTSCFPGMLLRYFLNDLWMVPVVPIITGITFPITFHMLFVYIVNSLHFIIYWASFLITCLSDETATSTNTQAAFPLSPITMCCLLLVMVLSICICWFHTRNVVTLTSCLISVNLVRPHTSVHCIILPLFTCVY